MDPLSITASAVTLMQVAGGISTALTKFLRCLRTADSRIASLCEEVATLTGFLLSVQQTLKGCNTFDLCAVEDGLWRQSELALANCQTTLNELDLLVKKIKKRSQPKGVGWRVRAVVDLSVHGDDLVAFRDKIQQSNWALQMMLSTITVTLSMRGNASQDKILSELDKLKSSIEEALHASSRPAGGFSLGVGGRHNTRIAYNLRNLAHAAENFHSAASSTASTIRGDGSEAYWPLRPNPAPSTTGNLSLSRRERVEQFLQYRNSGSSELERQPLSRSISSRRCSLRSSSSAHTSSRTPGRLGQATGLSADEEEDDAEFESMFLAGLRDLAAGSIRAHNYRGAIQLLEEAVKSETSSGFDDAELRHLQVQLAFCYFLEGNWRLAEPIVQNLAKSKADQDLAVWTLVHALSLAYFWDSSFEVSLVTCKQALKGKMRLCRAKKADSHEYEETLGLLATIYYETGDYIPAEVFSRKLPSGFEYAQPVSVVTYVKSHTYLLLASIGDDAGKTKCPSTKDNPVELDTGTTYTAQEPRQDDSGVPLVDKSNNSTLRAKQFGTAGVGAHSEVLFVDTGSASKGYDEATPILTGKESHLRRRLGRLFGSNSKDDQLGSEQVMGLPWNTISPISDTSPISLPSPTSRRIKESMMAHVKKPMTRFKKQPRAVDDQFHATAEGGNEQRTFKLLRMERITPPECSELSHPVSRDNYADNTPYRKEVANNSSESLLSPIIAELADTGMSPASIHDSRSIIGGSYDRSAVITNVQNSTADVVKVPRNLSGGPLDTTLSAEDLKSSISVERPKRVSGSESGLSELPVSQRPSMVPPLGGHPRRYLENGRLDSKVLRATPLPKIPRMLGNTLRELASIMASLSTTKDADSLQTRKVELEHLMPGLISMGSDLRLIQDVWEVIRNLELKTVVTSAGANDSGYESTEITEQRPNFTTPRTKMTSTKRTGALKRRPLKREYSWVEGSESSYTRRRVSECDRSKGYESTSPGTSTSGAETPSDCFQVQNTNKPVSQNYKTKLSARQGFGKFLDEIEPGGPKLGKVLERSDLRIEGFGNAELYKNWDWDNWREPSGGSDQSWYSQGCNCQNLR